MDNKISNEVHQFKDWFHQIEVAPGVITQGRDKTLEKYDLFNLPSDLFRGKTVLDLGARDGFYSFMAERMGAKRVVAVEIAPVEKTGFNIAKRLLNSNVEYLNDDFFNLNPKLIGTFDVVLFFGVLYHLRHPLLALDKIYSLCNETLILESLVIDSIGFARKGKRKLKAGKKINKIPLLQFYPGDELDNDFTTWIGPNISCIKAMMSNAGFAPTVLSTFDKRAVVLGKKTLVHSNNYLTSIEVIS